MRSFQLVEDKINESDFFLEKLISCTSLIEARFYLSAFLSSTRSITFALQASLSGVEGFDQWYQEIQSKLRENSLARFFVEARNESQKIGVYHINSGRYYRDEYGNARMRFYFVEFQPQEKSQKLLLQNIYNHDMTTDIGDLCKIYYTFLLKIIFECFSIFGSIIDPEEYFTLNNLKKINKTIEDIEEELGFPRGYTDVGIKNDEERLYYLRSSQPTSKIDRIFMKYLQKTRSDITA